MAAPKEPTKLYTVDTTSQAALLELWQDAKKRAADATAEADELRDQILHHFWNDEMPETLTAAGLGGLELVDSVGTPLATVTYTQPVRFDRAALKREHPELEAKYLRKASTPEVRVSLPK